MYKMHHSLLFITYFSDPSPHGLMHFQIGFCSLFILSTSSNVSGNLQENRTDHFRVMDFT